MTYISSYKHSIQISTVQSKNNVMDHLSKFHLNRTVNEPRSVVLRKLHRPEKSYFHSIVCGLIFS